MARQQYFNLFASAICQIVTIFHTILQKAVLMITAEFPVQCFSITADASLFCFFSFLSEFKGTVQSLGTIFIYVYIFFIALLQFLIFISMLNYFTTPFSVLEYINVPVYIFLTNLLSYIAPDNLVFVPSYQEP